METSQVKSAASFALSAALLALSASAFAADAPMGASGKAISSKDTVHCYNVNSCKGTADCATTAHSCKGQNSCKGQGFKALSAAECFKGNGVIGDIKG